MKAKAEDSQLTLAEKSRKMAVEDRIAKMEHKAHVRKFIANTLQRFLGARFLRPQRVMNLSPAEEKHRAQATLQNLDQIMHGMMKGEAKFMRQRFANPEQATENMKEAVLLFSDQIPVWIKITPNRQLFGKDEVRNCELKKSQAADSLLQLTGQTDMSQ